MICRRSKFILRIQGSLFYSNVKSEDFILALFEINDTVIKAAQLYLKTLGLQTITGMLK